MAYDFSQGKERLKQIEEWLKKELSTVRTGRATQAMLDQVMVESYGTRSPISHVATISIDDPKTLRIVPWDKSQIKAVDEALRNSDLGFSVSADEAGLRVSTPELTSERRAQMVKIVGAKLEDARIQVRKEREAVLSDCKKKKEENTLSEDEFFKVKDALQKVVDETNAHLEDVASKKEKEILG